ncbi:MAG: hypothetical protein QMD22_10545 [archaeon]|nr:hypothetical protein [archaeon]
MVKKGEGESGSEEERRIGILKQRSAKVQCPVCGARAYVRLSDEAIICREGGHVTYTDGRVTLHGGIETSLKELREKGVIKEGE